jgi:hypothetical protein
MAAVMTAERKVFTAAGLYGKTSRTERRMASWAGRAVAGAIPGAIAGGIWGAASDRESVIGGAVKGAFVGAAVRTGLRLGIGAGGPSRSGSLLMKIARLNNSRNFRDNLSRSWKAMSSTAPGLRNWMVGLGAVGAMRGMSSGNDNPVGGFAGGAIAGAMQGAMIYGGYRGMKNLKYFKNMGKKA